MATSVVCLPWRETEDRTAAHDLVVAWYENHGFVVMDVDSGHSKFNLAASRNLGVRQSQILDVDVVILSDADTVPEIGPLLDAIEAASTDHRVHLPYTRYHSMHTLQGDPVRSKRYTDLSHLACSGVFVTAASTWWTAGGMDERFTCWAPEDYAFRFAHETLIGPMLRHDGTVHAYPHLDQPGKAAGQDYDECVALYHRYLDAHMDPTAMRTLVAENRMAGMLR